MTFKKMATASATILRATMTSGKRGAAQVHLSNLQIVPLQPASPEVVQRMQLRTPHQVLETYVVGAHDILPGDVLVVNNRQYPIRGVGKWESPREAIGKFMHLVVEDIQL